MYLVRSRLNPFNAQLIEMSRDLKNIIERYNILTLTRNGLNMRTKNANNGDRLRNGLYLVITFCGLVTILIQ